jgi:quercetin dioxygenase-like cupin family protein
MPTYLLRLTRDRMAAGAPRGAPLPGMNRVLYVLEGELSVDAGGTPVRVGAGEAWHGAGPYAGAAGRSGATLLRYELTGRATASTVAPGASSTLLLEHDISLDPAARHLMRCDRVEFDLGGEALPHRHKGGGIRCLIGGTLELRVEGEPDRTIEAGQAWFESGREPVYARAAVDRATSFVRCSILPREIRGQSSIVYVDPRDARSKPRRYTVLVDEPIELP